MQSTRMLNLFNAFFMISLKSIINYEINKNWYTKHFL